MLRGLIYCAIFLKVALAGDSMAQIPVISDFHAESADVDAGETATLKWTVSGATGLKLEPGFGAVSGTGRVVTTQIAQWFPMVERGSVWRYNDARVDLYSPAVPFYHPDFDDSGWASGRARLGYGGDGEVTQINGGPNLNRTIASYYRQTFVLKNRSDISGAAIEVSRDDGVVIFVNGVEVLRDNMPAGAVGFTTLASSSAGQGDETKFSRFLIDSSVLKQGENVIAVGLHQSVVTSSDVGMDVELNVHLSGAAYYRLTATNGSGSGSSLLRVPVNGVKMGFGRFTAIPGHSGALLPGDMDGDGDMDFVCANAGITTVSWIENVDGEFVGRQIVVPRAPSLQIHAVHDLTGDGAVELIFRDENRLGYFVNDGAGGLEEDDVLLKWTLREYGSVLLGDPDEDGDEDIIVLDREDGVIGYYPYIGPGDVGDLTVIVNTREALPLNAFSMIDGDFDGDGNRDFMVQAEIGNFYWLRNTGLGTYVFSRVDNDQEPNPLSIYAADVDADGRDELLVNSVPVRNDRVHLYDLENGQWKHSVPFEAFYRFHSGDYSGDGVDDLFRVESNGNLTFFESAPGGEAMDSGYVSLLGGRAVSNNDPSYGSYGMPIDLDGDGDLDLIASGQVGGSGGVIFAENLTINDPLIVSFETDKRSLTPGGNAMLSWEVKFADRLKIVGIGEVTGNSVSVSPAQTTTYELVAYRDGNEVSAFVTVSTITDVDGDGLNDPWEILHFGSITAQNGSGDPDNDGANNAQEQAADTNPKLRDTDGDGLDDGTEIAGNFSDPKKEDTDDDGVGDALEFAAGTNARDGGAVPSAFLDGLIIYSGLDAADLILEGQPEVRNMAGENGTSLNPPTIIGDGMIGEAMATEPGPQIGFNTGLMLGESRTVSVWFRAFQQGSVILRMSGAGGFIVSLQSTGVYVSVPGAPTLILPYVVTGNWSHLAVSYSKNSGTYLASLNGLTTEAVVVPQVGGNQRFYAFPRGVQMDELAFWDRALNRDELELLHLAGQAGVTVPVLSGPSQLSVAEVVAPVGTTAYSGKRFLLEAMVNSLAPASIQWLHDGNVIPGETGAQLEIEFVSSSDAGKYSVRVANVAGVIDSAPLTVLVRDPVPALVKRLTPVGLLPTSELLRGSDLDGDLAAIGNSDPNDRSGGMVHLFERNEGGAENWGQVAAFRSDVPTSSDRFGQAIVIDDGLVVVGAPGTHFSHPGEVFVFEKIGATWQQTAKLTGGEFTEEFAFGKAMALHGGRLAVTAWKDERSGIGVVYIFERAADGTWTRVRAFDAPELLVFDSFGASVDLHEDVLVVGAPADATDFRSSGVAYVFERNAGGPDYWGYVSKVTSSPNRAGGSFGSAVAVYDDAFAGGSFEESSSRDQHGDYYFRRGGSGGWEQVQRTLFDFAGDARGRFADSLAMHGIYSLTLVPDAGRFYLRQEEDVNWEAFAVTNVPLDEDYGGGIHMSGSTILVEPWFIYEQAAVEPIIEQQPRAFAGSSGALRVRAGGNGELTYQWLRDGSPLPGAVESELTVDANNEGSYSVRVSNFFGSVESRAVGVERATLPVITVQPVAPERGQNGTPFFLVNASGAGNRYQWFLDGDAIQGATRARLDWPHPILGDAGVFTVQVTNPQGMVTSEPLNVTYGDISPVQIARLTNSDGEGFIRLGQAVEIKGTRAFVGAPYAEDDRGAVYVYEDTGVLSGGGWVEVARLISSDRLENDRFGVTLDFEGDLAIVGAPNKHGPGFSNKGAAYVFRRQPDGSWIEVQRLEGPDERNFGRQVVVENGRLFVATSNRVMVFGETGSVAGMRWEVIEELTDSPFVRSMDVSGDWLAIGNTQDATNGEQSGAVFLFQESPAGSGNWVMRKKLLASNSGVDKNFGYAVALDGDMLVAGENRGVDQPGSVFVFEKDAGGIDNWRETRRIQPSDGQPGDFFGNTIAIDEGAILLGAPYEDDGSQGAGSAYLYRRAATGGDWVEMKWGANDPGETHTFGSAVSMSRGQALIGGNGANLLGAAYLYMVDGPPAVEDVDVAGAVRAGVTAAAGFMFADRESDAEGTHRYQWFRADDATGGNSVEISGATSANYRPVAEDIGGYLSVRVTPLADSGFAAGAPEASLFTGPVERAITSVLITMDAPDPSVFGAEVFVSFGINVETEVPLAVVPGGTVTLSSAGSAPVVVNLPADSSSIRLMRTGRVDIVATYSGDEIFVGSAATVAHSVIPEVHLAAFDPDTVVEDAPGPVPVLLSRTGDTDGALTVMLSYGGDAERGDDFVAETTVEIPAGERSVPVEISLVADNLDEATETVEVILLENAAYSVVGEASVLTVLDDDFTPLGVTDSYSAVEDNSLVILPAGGVLANDTDEDDGGGPENLTAALVGGVSHGNLSLAEDGSFTYVPAPNYFGPDSFSYTASDGTNTSDAVLVTITVTEQVDLALIAMESREPVVAGHGSLGFVDHILSVRNNGPSHATGVVVNVSSVMPAGVTVSGGSLAGGKWIIGDLEEGAITSIILRYSASATAPGGTDAIMSSASLSAINQPVANPADDSAFIVTSIVSPASVAVLKLDVELVLNLQTGLFQQRIRVTNNNTMAVLGFRLLVGGLPEGVILRNGQDGVITYSQTLAPGASVVLTIEFQSKDRDPDFDPIYTVELLGPDDGILQPAAGGHFAIDRMLVLADGSVLIECPSEAGLFYAIEYSADMEIWKSAGPPVIAGGNRLQWIDNGAPKTSPHPGDAGIRYYRISLRENSQSMKPSVK